MHAAMTNLCRDEVTTILKDKIEAVFGGSFNTNGLGAALTCGVTGMKAGLSHSPTTVSSSMGLHNRMQLRSSHSQKATFFINLILLCHALSP